MRLESTMMENGAESRAEVGQHGWDVKAGVENVTGVNLFGFAIVHDTCQHDVYVQFGNVIESVNVKHANVLICEICAKAGK